MASTRAGRELTEAHRLAQIQQAQSARIEAAYLWPLLKFENLQGTRAAWQAANMLLLRSHWRRSQSLAAIYLSDFRGAERGSSLGPIVELDFPAARYADKLDELIPVGLDPDDIAWMQRVEREILAQVEQAALAGGRSTIDKSARAERVRYRRVTDGSPCAFCAMLAGRGPVYSEETAYFRSHSHCGCSAEPVYGTWTPSAVEREWAGSYVDAADAAKRAGEPINESTVLWRMRRNRPDLFSDGVQPKAAPTA